METKPACRLLVLDAGPLLSLSPLRGLAEHYITVPQVLSELKDKNAREHFERLGMSAGVKIELREPDAASLAKVTQFAKQTGDYSVLSRADLCVLALTLALDTQYKAEKEAEKRAEEANKQVEEQVPNEQPTTVETLAPSYSNESNEVGSKDEEEAKVGPSDAEKAEESEEIGFPENASEEEHEEPPASETEGDLSEVDNEQEPLEVTLEPISDDNTKVTDVPEESTSTTPPKKKTPVFDDPSDEDDGEGDWITPDNVDMYKSRALDLFPSEDSSDPFTTVSKKKGKSRRKNGPMTTPAGPKEQLGVGCMTADFAMQNVLLQMNLNLVGLEGKKIEKVKTWVLRCHACFKLCKDSSKKFCPSCGSPTLIRASVTVKSPNADESTPALEVHLKKNFVFRTRGTKYSIPKPKPGSSKTGTGEGLILREDQTAYMRAKKHEDNRREREERKLMQRSLEAAKSGDAAGIRLGSWMDPDWMPEMLSVGTGGKGRRVPDGRTSVGADGMPIIGYGRKNPNERRHKK